MQAAYLEHANLTVKDPDAAAALLQRLFNWNIRWSGPSLDHGYTCLLYTSPSPRDGLLSRMPSSA